MSWLGIILVILGIVLAIKFTAFVLRLVFVGIILVGLYLFLGPLLAVQVGMGESILILAFVVIVIGGIGSIRGALVGALLVGMVDSGGRTLLPMVFESLFGAALAADAAPAVASILIYVLMAAVLFFKPRGLFPAHG